MRISDKGIDLIKEFEGCRLYGYLCPAGVPTIGYGHTGDINGLKVSVATQITQADADLILKNDLVRYEKPVNDLVKVPLTQGQFDALVSFTYNCGAGALKTSDLLQKLNSGDYDGASNEFKRWNKGGGKILAGLVRRREAERVLFLSTSDADFVQSMTGFQPETMEYLAAYEYADALFKRFADLLRR